MMVRPEGGERLVLATDLDGTMAHGDAEIRQRLSGLLRSHPAATLIYVTGRAPEAAADLAERTPLPRPDILIADVGTSVLHGLGPERATEIEAELDAVWPGADAVRERLAPLGDDLVPQAVEAPRRLSYWVEPVRRIRGDAGGGDVFAARSPDDPSLGSDAAGLAADIGRRARERLDGLTVDVVVSANVFLDVLPRGVNKGSTLRRVLRWLGGGEDECVVAGDSLNDLGLFETGMRGVVVGNCEPALRDRVADMEQVYQARGEGVAGVLEGLLHHGYFGGDPERGSDHGQ